MKKIRKVLKRSLGKLKLMTAEQLGSKKVHKSLGSESDREVGGKSKAREMKIHKSLATTGSRRQIP